VKCRVVRKRLAGSHGNPLPVNLFLLAEPALAEIAVRLCAVI
jgi:hypothetical protein